MTTKPYAIADNRHAPLESRLAHDLERGVGADVTIFHVITAEMPDSQAQESTIRRLVGNEWPGDCDRLSVKLGRSDSVAQSLVAEAEQGVDLTGLIVHVLSQFGQAGAPFLAH